MLVVCVVTQLLVQYRLNLWNRDFFNALERRDGHEILQQTYLLPALAACSIALAATAVHLVRGASTSRLVIRYPKPRDLPQTG